ncbi:Dihydrolipoyllysine-residue succinyltransferase component of 2-oxoglutarate dehydrogenase complex, mitochondrial [Orchesella cincta]|uniref:Dihydrolipoyllysine-residue succinyltransferase component of 2-oxoglutarate dehydrogenase complex, mitochondrial n=1 Tax=Orchesella cincta TaxID=48709 RepID=A0A1D2NBT8_ORCCI|nr:Dihydrolipoyllysine-residue succinyltransferase component of 2-oxoglutarate dehydrogenase complex, mitochondrial [Orchesella cincta]
MLKVTIGRSSRKYLGQCASLWNTRSGSSKFSQWAVTTRNGIATRVPRSAVNLIISELKVAHESPRWLAGARYFHVSCPMSSDVKIVVVPQFADSISEGDVRWEKAVGDSVNEDETVCEIETDKTSIPVPAPGAGIIEEQFVDDGATVLSSKMHQLRRHHHPTSSGNKAGPCSRCSPPPKPAAAAAGPPPTTTTTSPKTFRHQDKVPPADPTKEITGTRTEQRVKMNRMRLRIAQRLKDAQNVNAMLTTFNEIDMSNITEMRKTYGDAFLKKHGMKLGFMSPFVKASAYALTELPVVNAVIDDQDVVYRDYVDISVAVATPKGLVVPVLRNVEQMSYADIERGMAALAVKARDGKLAVEDMDGGTFTISNGGVFGSLMGTPIINPPQSAILGMHGIFDRPVARNGQVVIRPMMYVALTYDHRLVDGREAVMFLRKIKACVEDPRNLLLDF